MEMTYNEMVNKLKVSTCKVVFTKKDGSTREMKCTLQEDVIAPHFTSSTKPVQLNEEVISVIDTDIDEWRRFRVDSVQSFEVI